jgi:O-methyltransferase involved in polyketide biosynthesis
MEQIALPTKINPSLQNNIAETLFITLYMKSQETLNDDPILFDTTSLELVDQIDYDFSKFSNAERSAVGVCVRARYFDKMVTNFIKEKDHPIVVILGCGLDSRFHRIGEINEKATFYEIDLPEVIELRERLIPPQDNDIYVPISVLDVSWMDTIKELHPDGSFLFVAEGLFMYFDKVQLRNLLVDFTEHFKDAEIYFDIVNKWMSKNSHLHDSVKFTDAEFKSGFDDDREFESWTDGLTYLDTKLFTSEKNMKKRLGMSYYLLKLIPRFKYAGRMLHYRIN